MAKTEWLDSDGNLNPDIFWSDSEIDWEELKKHAYITPDWVRNPETRPKHREDMRWFLDHWLIERKDGDTVLNGKAEEFEKQLRDLISNARTIKNS